MRVALSLRMQAQARTVLRHALPIFAVLTVAASASGGTNTLVRTLDIDVVDASKTGTESTRFVLALDGQKPAKMALSVGDLSYQIDARLESSSAAVGLSIHRYDKRPGSPARVDLELSVSPPPGARTVVASALRPDGSKVELAVRLH